VSGFPASVWLVGAGNMGGAMLRRWLDSGVEPASVTVIDPFAAEVPEGVTLVAAMPAGSPEVLVLAVKPQLLDKIPHVRAGTLISILAGVEEAVLAGRFEAEAIIRAMPNLPVSLGKGVVALHTYSEDPQVRAAAEALMAPLGLVEWIGDEALFHAVTALSGSGPGFVYRFIESLAESGARLGLPADQALRFAVATVEGAAALAAASGEPPAVLAERVASPGGTTRAGLNVLDKDHALHDLVDDTLAAASRRSAELAEAARE
jgi:pyrroline-5-carboxylate reductase